MLPRRVGHARSAHHAHKLLHASLTGQRIHARDRTPIEDEFFNAVLVIRESGDLRQVRYAKNLVP